MTDDTVLMILPSILGIYVGGDGIKTTLLT
jgi:hypothetical protein